MKVQFEDSFYSKYIDFPKLQYKLRADYMSVNGKRLYYNDIFKVVCKKTGKTYNYMPSFMVEDIADDDIVLDGFPFYLIGLVDLIDYYDNIDIADLGTDLFTYLTNMIVRNDLNGQSFDSVIKNVQNLVENGDRKFFACLQSIRGTNIDCSLPRTREFVDIMLYQYYFDKRSFFETFFTLMDYLQIFIEFTVSGESFCDHPSMGEELKFLKYVYSRYSYKSKDKQYYISNGRGISHSFLGLFYYYLFKTFKCGDSYYDSVINYEEIEERLNKRIRKCIGDDLLATFITNKTCDFKDLQKTYDLATSVYDDVTGTPRTRIKGEKCNTYLDNNRVDRDILENLILYKKSLTNMSRSLKEIYNNVDGKVMNYFNFCEVERLLGGIFLNAYRRGILIKEQNEVIDVEKYEAQIDNLRSVITEYKSQLSSQNSNLDMIESLQNELQEQRGLILSKNNIITDLTAEVKRLNEELTSYYSEDEFDDDDTEADVSLEEMVQFLNDFRIQILGGRENLYERLVSAGLNDVSQVMSHNMYSSTAVDADFIVINTKFVSHKLVRVAQERFKTKLDCFIYYNGTNSDGLIKACYDYINNWLN